jgi:hypothetical protein
MIGGKILLDSKAKVILACLICIVGVVELFFLGFFALSWAQESAWYCRPYGTVEYRGEPAPDGLKVVALIGDEEFDHGVTKGGEYVLLIPKDDPATTKKEGWAEEDVITIKVNGSSANPRFKAFAGTQKINLYVSTLDVKLTTWGKIKALFR